MDNNHPRWIRDLIRFLPLRSQFVLWGNTRDRFAYFPDPSQSEVLRPLPIAEYLAEHLADHGIHHLLAFAPHEGLRIIQRAGVDPEEEAKFFSDKFQLPANGDSDVMPMSVEAFFEWLPCLVRNREEPVAIAIDLASRMIVRPDMMTACEQGLFTQALLHSLRAEPLRASGDVMGARFNSLFWIADREGDLPAWLVLENPRVRSIAIPSPDAAARTAVSAAICRGLPEYDALNEEMSEAVVRDFVDSTDGLKLSDLIGIAQLCQTEGLKFSELAEGARRYKIGVTEDPWKKIDRDRIHTADGFVRTRLKGQDQPVTGMLDIVKRAVMGVSGGRRGRQRPRGVAFLAGPTGTGKTELAKTITQLLFGDEDSYIRFDMSEFSAEHSDQRLIGAPPGYVGYDEGGELTNAIREKPFSVILFDEIEKAHPLILDKFLQILDDGVLTSGRGERVYFSEAFIIFTSNLGIYRINEQGRREPNVEYGDSYENLCAKVRREIDHFFKLQLGRPEILNRLGENFLIFDFIRPGIGEEIFELMLGQTLAQFEEQTGIEIHLPDDITDALRVMCIADLSNGGRGIRNQLEARFTNPLARALFDGNFEENTRAAVTAIVTDPTEPAGLEVKDLG